MFRGQQVERIKRVYMNDEEKRIVNKLKALIDNTPYAGEKATALNVLKKYCEKHNISEEELNEPEEKTFDYDISRDDYTIGIFRCVAFWFFDRKGINFSEGLKFYTYKGKKFKHLACCEIHCKPADFVELVAEFEQYNAAFKKQLSRFLKKQKDEFKRAFLDKNNLLLPFDFYKRIGKEEPIDMQKAFIESAGYIYALSGAKSVEIHKQIGESKNG